MSERILVINPNSSEAVTRVIDEATRCQLHHHAALPRDPRSKVLGAASSGMRPLPMKSPRADLTNWSAVG